MNNIGIRTAEFYLPEKKIQTNTLDEYQKILKEKNHILKKTFDNTGIKNIRSAGNITAIDLAINACLLLFENKKINPNEIDCLIHLQGRSPTYLMSSELTKLQKTTSLSHARPLSLTGLGCVDISSALILAKQLIQANCYKNVLICYGSTPVFKKRFRNPVTIIGDGGMAILISETSSNKILDHEISVNGKYWDLYFSDYRNTPLKEWQEICKDLDQYSFELAIESKNQFERINQKILNRRKMLYKNIDHFIMQNISTGAFDFYEDVFSINFCNECQNNLKNLGHLGSIDIILNYFSLLSSQKCNKNEKVLIMNNSPIAAWSSLLIEI